MINAIQLAVLAYSIKGEGKTIESVALNTTERRVLAYFSDMSRKIFPVWHGNTQKRERVERRTQEHLIQKGLVEYKGTHNGWDYYQITAKGIASL